MADLLTPDPKRLVAVDRLEMPPTPPGVIQSTGYSAALSSDQQTISDTIAQVYRGTSVVRHSPLPVQASAAAGAAANSAAKVIVENAASTTVTYVPGNNVTFTQSGPSTAINATVPSAGGDFLPKPNSGVYWYARATAGSLNLQTFGDTSTQFTNANGTITTSPVPTSTLGTAVNITAGTLAGGGYAGFVPNGNGAFGLAAYNFWAGRNCRFQARITADSQFFVGGVTTDPSAVYLGFTVGSPTDMRAAPPTGRSGFDNRRSRGIIKMVSGRQANAGQLVWLSRHQFRRYGCCSRAKRNGIC